MKFIRSSTMLAVLSASFFSASAVFAAPDVSKLLTNAEVEAALKAKVDKADVKTLPTPLGGTQITYSTKGLPVKTFALTVRTADSLAPNMKAAGMSPASMYKQDKAISAGCTALIVKGGEGFTTSQRSEILKNGIQLNSLTLFGTSKEATDARNSLLIKAADRI